MGIHITKGSGKMEGIFSINTSTLKNKFCTMMAKTSDICSACYASRYEKMRSSLAKALERNSEYFVSDDFEVEKVPYLFMRFHSFGELISRKHLRNVIRLVEHNPDTRFTLWSKRTNYIQGYIREYGALPSNLIMIYSNPSLNVERKTPPKGFNKVFNVFTKKFAEENGIVINCGGKACLPCMICYTHNDTTYVNELKK